MKNLFKRPQATALFVLDGLSDGTVMSNQAISYDLVLVIRCDYGII